MMMMVVVVMMMMKMTTTMIMMIIMTTMMILFWDLHTCTGSIRPPVNGQNFYLLLQPPREGGLLRRLGARSRCFCCLDPIPPNEGGARKTTKNKNFDRRLLSTTLDSGTRPYMPGKRAASRVERAIMLLTALKPDRMGAERARLLNKEQRYPFVVTHSLTHS